MITLVKIPEKPRSTDHVYTLIAHNDKNAVISLDRQNTDNLSSEERTCQT